MEQLEQEEEERETLEMSQAVWDDLDQDWYEEDKEEIEAFARKLESKPSDGTSEVKDDDDDIIDIEDMFL